jgi:hypothetical protein
MGNPRDEALALLDQVPRDPSGTWPPTGASAWEIREFARRNDLRIPPELEDWLAICNGAGVGPGGLYGIEEIDRELEYRPIWRRRGWIPLANDGSGNDYIFVIRNPPELSGPVFFLDHSGGELDPEVLDRVPTYVVASGLWTFLRFLFLSEVATRNNHKLIKKRDDGTYDFSECVRFYWPFDRERVLEADPDLKKYRGTIPLAWECD